MEAGTAEATEPVGTGAVRLLRVQPRRQLPDDPANADYWLEAPDGEPYPYLDEIEFLVQAENQTRTTR